MLRNRGTDGCGSCIGGFLLFVLVFILWVKSLKAYWLGLTCFLVVIWIISCIVESNKQDKLKYEREEQDRLRRELEQRVKDEHQNSVNRLLPFVIKEYVSRHSPITWEVESELLLKNLHLPVYNSCAFVFLDVKFKEYWKYDTLNMMETVYNWVCKSRDYIKWINTCVSHNKLNIEEYISRVGAIGYSERDYSSFEIFFNSRDWKYNGCVVSIADISVEQFVVDANRCIEFNPLVRDKIATDMCVCVRAFYEDQNKTKYFTLDEINKLVFKYESSMEVKKEFVRVQRAAVTDALRFKILQRDNFKCQLCGRTAQDGVTLEVDHKIPISRGGISDESNLWTLCKDCNRSKSNKILDI